MNKISKILASASVLAMGMLPAGCNEDSPVSNPPVDNKPVEIERGTYARGADVSWLTQLEAEGEKFYSPDGSQMECMQLLKEHCGVNAIRLRVWVNPAEGWNNVDDVIVKARRANALGLRLMIDFHFSDTWADPGQQQTPAAWTDLDMDGLKSAVAAHVNEMLTGLAAYGVEPEWVQIGNETRAGMLYPLGSIDNPENFTDLVSAGYDAVKAVFPAAAVIVHLDGGDNQWLYDRIFGALATHGGKYDMIGMSLYPEPDSWQGTVDDMIANINHVTATYGKPVMICEVGMDYREAEACNAMLSDIIARTENLNVKGVFYWEPEAPAGYNGGYNKGCFDNGAPTAALDAFKM
ncbi:MAG: arabinogalactan endo-1,4-beta-galactosidase [Barnesiella sp.]|nr:arabinogalactan endo-1,4-beta-galactosidase [Barnesiella sp.]MBD5258754.1 arabinogalactan endo-1,4-beta-galactosidase [Barnesiella sp.]